MRVVLGFLSGVLGGIAGCFALAALTMALSGPDRNGDIAMAAIFVIGPFGGFAGFVAGMLPFSNLVVVRQAASGSRTRISRPYAGVVLAIAGAVAWLAWLAWYELMG
jgi:hypothetical protein